MITEYCYFADLQIILLSVNSKVQNKQTCLYYPSNVKTGYKKRYMNPLICVKENYLQGTNEKDVERSGNGTGLA